MNRKALPQCSVGMTVQMIGGKWKSVILYHLLEGGTLRFGELRLRLGGITQRMLTLQLRELETTGLIRRKVYAVVPPRVEYSLTDFGRSLEPVITAMRAWGKRYEKRCEKFLDEADEALAMLQVTGNAG
jgi:DNA-binding HxlR family transcriptional regulator